MGTEATFVKSGDVKQEQYVLAQHEIESLEQSLSAHEQVLGASEAYRSGAEGPGPVLAPGMAVNRRRLGEQARQIKKTLDTSRPEPIPENLRDKYRERQKWLEKQFVDYIETRAELHVFRRDRPEWQSAMEKAKLRPKYEEYIREWQFIDRRLRPGDPDAGNLHRLRRDK